MLKNDFMNYSFVSKIAKSFFVASMIIFSSCHLFTNDYDKMLAGLYAHTVPIISCDSLEILLYNKEKIELLDCREQAEYEVSHLKNAAFAGYNNFDLTKMTTSKDATIVLYCSVGYRSERIGEKLQKAGFLKVYNLYAGIFGWVNHQKEVVDMQNVPTNRVHVYNSRWGKWLKSGKKVL